EEAMAMSDRIAVMRGGRILQCADPRTLYREPADEFVGRFLGDANILRVSAVEAEGMRLEGGLVGRVPATAAARAGDLIMVRPEDIKIVSAREREALGTAEVAEVAYLGSSVVVRLKSELGLLAAKSASRAVTMQRGD